MHSGVNVTFSIGNQRLKHKFAFMETTDAKILPSKLESFDVHSVCSRRNDVTVYQTNVHERNALQNHTQTSVPLRNAQHTVNQ